MTLRTVNQSDTSVTILAELPPQPTNPTTTTTDQPTTTSSTTPSPPNPSTAVNKVYFFCKNVIHGVDRLHNTFHPGTTCHATQEIAKYVRFAMNPVKKM